MIRILYLAFLLPALSIAQHKIKGSFSNPNGNVVLLYKITPTSLKYIKHAKITKNNHFEMPLDSTVSKGIYRVVYGVPQEDYNFDVIYNGNEDIAFTLDSTSVAFQASVENQLLTAYTDSMTVQSNRIRAYFKNKQPKKRKLEKIFKAQRKTQELFEKKAAGHIVLDFIKANKPYIPTKALGIKDYIAAQKTHFFDYVDFRNSTLQSSKFLEKKMLSYVFDIPNSQKTAADRHIENLDVFCKAMKSAPVKVKKKLLTDLWIQTQELKQNKLTNHLTDVYLTPLANELQDRNLLERLRLYKNTSVGNTPPNFSFEITKDGKTMTESLNNLTGYKYYLVVFWSSGCSHCLKAIPKLHKYIQSQAPKTIKVIAIGLEDEPYNWKRLTYEFPEFIHVYGQGKWDNPIGNKYNITATPTYYLLGADKKILDKPSGVKALDEFIKKQSTEKE